TIVKRLLKRSKRNKQLFLTFLGISAHIRNAFINTHNQEIYALYFNVRTQDFFARRIQFSDNTFTNDSNFAFIFNISVIDEPSLENIHRLLLDELWVIAINIISPGFCASHHIVTSSETT